MITAALEVARTFLAGAGTAVVLKAITQAHKADLGLVITDARDDGALERGWSELASRATPPFLVQRQVAAGPEVIVGVRQDRSFGPVVMLGLGGHFTERVARREIRLAPVDQEAASEMVERLLGKRLDSLAHILIDMSRLAVERPDILELDLNPVILGREGASAVDLRIVEGEPFPKLEVPPDGQQAIRRMLQPASVAIIGASANPEKPGGRTLRYLRRFAPDTMVHAVNPRCEVIDGLQTVAAISDLPTGIDVAVVATPARDVPRALEELRGRDITGAIVYAGGFAEAGNEAAEAEVRALARGLGVRVCGVNTMGLAGDAPLMFSQAWEMNPLKGSVSYVSQSGALSGSLLIRSWDVGLGTARAICVGNQTDLDASDYLEYLATDDATRTVGVFLEGVRDGRRLAGALKTVTRNGKGLAVLRAGASEVAAAAARSHTGALAGSPEIYRQVVKEAGGALARDLSELVGLCQALDWQPRASSRRVGIISTSGGAGTLLADLVGSLGLTLPQLEDRVRKQIQSLLPAFASTRNPLDTTAAITYAPELLGRMATPALGSSEVDLLLVAISTLTGNQADIVAQDLVRLGKRSSKPLVIAWSLPESTVRGPIARLRAAKLPVFDSFALAAAAAAALCGRVSL